MPKDSDIIEFENQIDDGKKWVKKLSDEKFAALDIDIQLKNAELTLKLTKEKIEQLKEQATKMPKPPKNPNPSFITTRMMQDMRYRFIGRRNVEEKVYHLPKGTLTD